MRLEHNISKDSASPSSIEKTDVITLISVPETNKSFIPAYFELIDKWTKDVKYEKEYEVEKSRGYEEITIIEALPSEEEYSPNISEFFNISKDSALKTPQEDLENISISNTSELSIDIKYKIDSSKVLSQDDLISNYLYPKQEPSNASVHKPFETISSNMSSYQVDPMKYGLDSIEKYLNDMCQD
jgi:hypothetical protein